MSSVLMDGQVFDNEIPFCKVFTLQAKQELERVFLRHRISYFVEWENQSFWQKLFTPRGNRISCTIRINKADFKEARDLARGIKNVRIRNFSGAQERDAVKELARKKETQSAVKKRKSAQPVIRKSGAEKKKSTRSHAPKNASSRQGASRRR